MLKHRSSESKHERSILCGMVSTSINRKTGEKAGPFHSRLDPHATGRTHGPRPAIYCKAHEYLALRGLKFTKEKLIKVLGEIEEDRELAIMSWERMMAARLTENHHRQSLLCGISSMRQYRVEPKPFTAVHHS